MSAVERALQMLEDAPEIGEPEDDQEGEVEEEEEEEEDQDDGA